MRLLLTHPAVALRDCADCIRYVYDESTGSRALARGLPVRRPAGTGPPCSYGSGACPKGSPRASRALNPANARAYAHHLACRAVHRFPDDPIVTRNAAIIRLVEKACAREGRDG